MKKVYLTQQEMFKFMKEKRQDSLSPNLRKYYEARQEMNDWLEKDDVPEDTKATMYAHQLQRVNQLKNQVFRPEPSSVQMITHTGQTMTSESDTSQQLSATDKQIIIDSVPKTMQNYAKLLIQKLKDHSDVISRNDNGQLVLDGSTIPNSNIVDLVNDVMRKRKKVLIQNIQAHLPKHSQKLMYQMIRTPIESIPYVGTVDYKILKHPDHHLFQSQLKHLLKYHGEHPKAQRLPLLPMVKSTSIIELIKPLPFFNCQSIMQVTICKLGALAKFLYTYKYNNFICIS